MAEAPVLVECRAGYRVLTLNRPQQLNAFNEAMHQALKQHVFSQVGKDLRFFTVEQPGYESWARGAGSLDLCRGRPGELTWRSPSTARSS